MVLAQAYAFFPVGTIHLAVVDPGVGTDRRPIAARLGEHLFVGPDNGLFTPILEAVEEQGGRIAFFHANNPRYWLPNVSHTFHGRDVFAPVAAHLAKGVPLSEVGEEINDPVRLKWPLPEETKNGWQAHIVGIDRFGNLATDLPGAELGRVSGPVFRLRGREVRGLVRSYGERPARRDAHHRLCLAASRKPGPALQSGLSESGSGVGAAGLHLAEARLIKHNRPLLDLTGR